MSDFAICSQKINNQSHQCYHYILLVAYIINVINALKLHAKIKASATVVAVASHLVSSNDVFF